MNTDLFTVSFLQGLIVRSCLYASLWQFSFLFLSAEPLQSGLPSLLCLHRFKSIVFRPIASPSSFDPSTDITLIGSCKCTVLCRIISHFLLPCSHLTGNPLHIHSPTVILAKAILHDRQSCFILISELSCCSSHFPMQLRQSSRG